MAKKHWVQRNCIDGVPKVPARLMVCIVESVPRSSETTGFKNMTILTATSYQVVFRGLHLSTSQWASCDDCAIEVAMVRSVNRLLIGEVQHHSL